MMPCGPTGHERKARKKAAAAALCVSERKLYELTSPRGDLPGFVRVHDEKTLMMPDRRGNNRVDSLRNIVRDPRIALLFLIPGSGSTLRVNGRAEVSAAARPGPFTGTSQFESRLCRARHPRHCETGRGP